MLLPTTLARSLATRWLGADPHPRSAAESADLLAGCVAEWFAAATAGAFPCATAQAKRPLLASLAAPALASGAGPAAGLRLADAAALYMAGQSFGPGVSGPPAGATAAGLALGAAFLDLGLDTEARATVIAAALHLMALTTTVAFPPPLPPLPVM